MAADHALEPTEMWQALQDLYTLCVQDFTVLYLPKSRPVDGACPVKCCQLRMDSEPGLAASQQLKTWSRDHKLWCHIDDEHLVDRRWPLICRLCDVPLKDAGALRCHFADEHGLSRTRPVRPAHSAALGSQDEKMLLDKEASGALPSRKRKSSSDTPPVEWMPPQSFDGAPASPAEPSPCLPQKRPRHSPPAICPMVLSLDEAFSADQSAYNVKESVMISPGPALSTENDDKCDALECDLFLSHCTSLNDTIESVEQRDVDDDIVFDQYLRSPSPSLPPTPSLDDPASESSGATLINAGGDLSRGSPELYAEIFRGLSPVVTPEGEMARDHADPGRIANGPCIRLRISQPKITLRLKLQGTGQHGKKKRRTGEKEDREKEDGRGNSTRKRKKGTKSEKAKKGKR
ncbi:hypothetical protein LTR47_011194 [Exophiala xenobiotica]|nr:hypothetical protein LTR41_011198 [Exophiala xenobiotica]KAK5215432.1 hypothetical protein LTR72_011515 [Exophiala xenobiotica]KAK5220361.1 hypothetical protein LTR47_011194 [Exophiala xenobiotica]